MRSNSLIIDRYIDIPQKENGMNMVEKMHPYETPIMKRLGTVKDLTQAGDWIEAVDPTSGEIIPPV
jgi:hypothetical protein